jgi:NAD+ synthase (glutamine-hydrolysing)
MLYAASEMKFESLSGYGATSSRWPNLNAHHRIIEAPPTAELEPITETYQQTDEQDMGMSYDDLSVYGRLRKISQVFIVGSAMVCV